MKKTKILLSALLSLIFSQCTTSKDIIKVQNVKQIQTVDNNYLPYVLPQNQIIVKITVRKIDFYKGQYHEFATKYLGSNIQTITNQSTIWEIANTEIFSVPVVDTANEFLLAFPKKFVIPFVFSNKYFPLCYNCSDYERITSSEISIYERQNNSKKDTLNKFLIEPKPYKISYDTMLIEKEVDTFKIQMPILKPTVIQKTKEEQAKEIADKLNTLREDRYLMLVGQSEKPINSADLLNQMLKELYNTELLYIRAFTGYADTSVFTYFFSYTPRKTDNNFSIPLFRFSDKLGILSKDDKQGAIAFLRFENKNLTIDSYTLYANYVQAYNIKKKDNLLPYRIPQITKVSLNISNKNIASQEIPIAQFGTIGYLNANILLEPDVSIVFDSTTGAIIKILKK